MITDYKLRQNNSSVQTAGPRKVVCVVVNVRHFEVGTIEFVFALGIAHIDQTLIDHRTSVCQ